MNFDSIQMAKEEKVPQGVIDKLIEVGRCRGMEINVEKTKVIRISRQTSPVTIMVNQTQLESVRCFKYLGSMLTNDGRCTCEIKCSIRPQKAVKCLINSTIINQLLTTQTVDLPLFTYPNTYPSAGINDYQPRNTLIYVYLLF